MRAYISELSKHIGETVTLEGWLVKKRSSGKIGFLQIRDGSGDVQGVASRADLDEVSWQAIEELTQESTLRVSGVVQEDKRAPSGVEVHLGKIEILAISPEFPISPKEHGVSFLMEKRHLWLRSSRQRAALRVRSEVSQGIRDFFYERGFTLIDSPILTPAACEGTSTLFETDYFGEQAYLSQSGQLYLEPAAAALGKVYCFGPTFRAEKSKTRRHLMEFWMVEPEVAFLEFGGLCELAEEFVCALVARVLDRCSAELATLERDRSVLESITAPFPRITYSDAIDALKADGLDVSWGDDLGAEEETALASRFGKPVLLTHFPAAIKAFYMEPDPDNPDQVLGVDVLAPEGYGEIIGGSQRIHDHDLLLERIRAHDLPLEAFDWYLDVRKFGTFPHSGFGMGLERFVAWVTGLKHLRETIPYPRMLNKIYP